MPGNSSHSGGERPEDKSNALNGHVSNYAENPESGRKTGGGKKAANGEKSAGVKKPAGSKKSGGKPAATAPRASAKRSPLKPKPSDAVSKAEKDKPAEILPPPDTTAAGRPEGNKTPPLAEAAASDETSAAAVAGDGAFAAHEITPQESPEQPEAKQETSVAAEDIKTMYAPPAESAAAGPESAKEAAAAAATAEGSCGRSRGSRPAGTIRHMAALCGRQILKWSFAQNPVLARLLAICTVLGASSSLKNGLLLCAAAAAVSLLLYPAAEILRKWLPHFLLLPCILLLSGLILTPVVFFSGRYAAAVTASVGIFLPITAVNTALMAEQKTKAANPLFALARALGDTLGFSAVMLIVSALREIFGSGTLCGRPLSGYMQIHFNFLLLPPAAFLLFGLLLAAAQGCKRLAAGRKERGSGPCIMR